MNRNMRFRGQYMILKWSYNDVSQLKKKKKFFENFLCKSSLYTLLAFFIDISNIDNG